MYLIVFTVCVYLLNYIHVIKIEIKYCLSKKESNIANINANELTKTVVIANGSIG
jgi:hypothetical protein